jgi:hypothetical protein
MKILILDDYFDNNNKSLIFTLGLFLTAFLLNIISDYINLGRVINFVLFLSLITLLIIILRLKKSLIYKDNKLYNSIIFKNKVLVKAKIDTEKFSYGSVKKLEKTNEFWNLHTTVFATIFGETNAYSIILHSKNEESDLSILTLSNSIFTNKAIKFIEQNSTIEFSE